MISSKVVFHMLLIHDLLALLIIQFFSILQSNKPFMERKRRARINNCLGQLKTLVLQAMRKDVSTCN